MILKLLFGIGAGALLGALLGSTRSCTDGGCPLTATPLRGMLYGMFMGTALSLSLIGEGRQTQVGDTSPANAAKAVTADAAGSPVTESQTIVVFTADWCPACKQYAPFYQAFSKKHEEPRVQVVDTDRERELAVKYGIRALPTTLLLEGEVEIKRHLGAMTEAELSQFVDQPPIDP